MLRARRTLSDIWWLIRYPEQPRSHVLDLARRTIREDQLEKQILQEIVDTLPSRGVAPQPGAQSRRLLPEGFDRAQVDMTGFALVGS